MVIGDVITDVFMYGHAIGISAETPTVVAEFEGREVYAGGAGLVHRHLIELGAESIVTTLGQIPQEIFDVNRMKGLGDQHVTQKVRYFVDGYKKLQFDSRPKLKHTDESREYVMKSLEIFGPDAIVIADNRHGTLDYQLVENIKDFASKRDVPIYVDSQVSQERQNFRWYTHVDYIFMNERELNLAFDSAIINLKLSVEDVEQRALELSRYYDANIIVKRGSRGVWFVSSSESRFEPAYEVKTVDTCGAGDALLAAYVMTDDLRDSAAYASFNCTIPGTRVPKKEEYDAWKASLR